MKEYDLVVIGSGVGLTVVSQAINYGWNCALVEEGKMGGTCLTRGCIPSKVLIYPADLIREAEHAKNVGVHFKVEKIDWGLISKRVWQEIDESKDIEQGLKHAPNLDVYRGIGEFTGEYQMKVKLNDGGTSETFKGKRFVIASGGRTFIPPIKNIEETGYITTRSFFGEKFPKQPWKSLIIIGGGVIAAEFAHLFSAMGTKVTIVEMLPRLVSTEEPEISAYLEHEFKKHMTVLLGKKAVEAKKSGKNKTLIVEDVQTGEKQEVSAEEILIAAGRRSNSDWLKPEKTGVKVDKRGWVITNEFLETNKKNIWCIGDANGKFQFRHTANYETEILIRNMFAPDDSHKTPVDYSVTPWAIFTYPQIGHVGMTEKQAIESGHQIYVAKKYYYEVAKGFALGFSREDQNSGFVKLIVDKSRKILGAHVIGPHAAILIQQIVYIMNAGTECLLPGPRGDLKLVSSRTCPGAGSISPIYKSQVIHPSLNEVIGWSLGSLRPVNIKHSEGHDH
ncbi:MAG: dihydrolipoyl dehydrogenase [Promethearchaeota archaeon]